MASHNPPMTLGFRGLTMGNNSTRPNKNRVNRILGGVITYSCQGQQVIQVRGLQKKCQSIAFREFYFRLESSKKTSLSFNDGDLIRQIKVEQRLNMGRISHWERSTMEIYRKKSKV
jgi:hypothetical protein